MTTTFDYEAPGARVLQTGTTHDLHLPRLWHAECVKAQVTGGTVQVMLVQGLIERDQATTRFAVAGQGRAVLSGLLDRAGIDMPQN